MVFKLKIFSIGKTKETWLEEAVEEYTRRLKPILSVDCIWAKENAHLLQLLQFEKNIICCDQDGQEWTSSDFALMLRNTFEKGGTHLSIVIGWSDGLPEQLKKKYPKISLSKLTFTHQMARLILLEQVYRATQIWQNTPYHK